MEPLVLRKTLIRLAVILTMIVFAVIVWRRRSSLHVNSECAVYGELAQPTNPCAARGYVPLTHEELQSYQCIADKIVEAYSNGHEQVMAEWAKRLPTFACGLKGEDYHRVILPINQVWFADWFQTKEDEVYASVETFECKMRLRVLFARIYGAMILNSGMENDILATIDCRTLQRLQKYKIKFTAEKKEDYVRVVDRLIYEWIQQIESGNGFTHAYLRSQEHRLKRLVEKGELTPMTLRRNIRSLVCPLQKLCGYTPKWLDEDFPLPEGSRAVPDAGRKF